MAATVISSEVITWATGANPAAQNITVPGDCTAVYMFYAYFATGTAVEGTTSVTLNSAAPSQSITATETGDGLAGAGLRAWYSPATDTRSLDVEWDNTPAEGPVCIVVYVKGGDTSAWRNAHASGNAVNPATTLTTVAGDLVIKFDQRYGTPPSLTSGWTSIATAENGGEGARASYISAAGTSVVCGAEDLYFSSLAAVAIPEGAGGSTYTPRSMLLGVG